MAKANPLQLKAKKKWLQTSSYAPAKTPKLEEAQDLAFIKLKPSLKQDTLQIFIS